MPDKSVPNRYAAAREKLLHDAKARQDPNFYKKLVRRKFRREVNEIRFSVVVHLVGGKRNV